MKRNILLVANGDIESELDIVDAATRTAHGVRRASTQSRPWQILRRNLKNIDAVIVDLGKHSQALPIMEAFGCSENMPPVIVLTSPQMAATAYRHGATICVTKPFSVEELASVIDKCLPAHASIRRRTSGRSDLDLHAEGFAARTTGLTGCRAQQILPRQCQFSTQPP
jgi:DNA-binding response OmpR family regulator